DGPGALAALFEVEVLAAAARQGSGVADLHGAVARQVDHVADADGHLVLRHRTARSGEGDVELLQACFGGHGLWLLSGWENGGCYPIGGRGRQVRRSGRSAVEEANGGVAVANRQRLAVV